MWPTAKRHSMQRYCGDYFLPAKGDTNVVSNAKTVYEKEPRAIEERSFRLIRDTLSCYAIDKELMDIAVRLVHAGADFALANLLEAHNNALEAARTVLPAGGEIFCDVEMLKAGVSRTECARMGLETVCFIRGEETARRAASGGVTRAMASVDAAVERGVRIFAFGNAPTALFRLLEHIERGVPVDFICGMPVGFVGAADSKEALAASGVPSLLLRGPRGGSSLCAACMNALLRLV